MYEILFATPRENEITEIISPALKSMGYELVRTKIMEGPRTVLQIMAEREKDHSMGIEDCEKISKTISPILDVENPITTEYELEVSSPGVDRPLTRKQDFNTFAGREAKLALRHAVDGRRKFKGIVRGLSDSGDVLKFYVNDPEDKVMEFNLTDIENVKLSFSNVVSMKTKNKLA